MVISKNPQSKKKLQPTAPQQLPKPIKLTEKDLAQIVGGGLSMNHNEILVY